MRHNQHEIEREDGEDSLHHELESQHFQRDDKQRQVDNNVGVFDTEARGVVDNGGQSRHAAGHNLVGHEENGERNGVQKETDGDEQIVLGLIPDLLFTHHLMTILMIFRGTMITLTMLLPSKYFRLRSSSRTDCSISSLEASTGKSF